MNNEMMVEESHEEIITYKYLIRSGKGGDNYEKLLIDRNVFA